MDDILENLGIILLIAISVTVQIVKMAKKAAKNGKATLPADMEESVYDNSTTNESNTRRNVFTTSAKTAKRKPDKTLSNIDSKPNRTNNTAKPKIEQSNTETGRTDDFDLRKAVIYSEILTPKFKEE